MRVLTREGEAARLGDAAGRVLSVSRAVAWARCRRAERLQYGAGLVPIAVEGTSDARLRGTCIHAGMAAGIARFPADPDAAEVEAAVRAAAVEEGAGANHPDVGAWTRIALRALRAMRPADWEPVALDGAPLVERRLEVPLLRAGESVPAGAAWLFSLKPDAVLRHRPSGRLWAWDHKTHASLGRSAPWTELHLQALAYWHALDVLGVPLAGFTLYHVLAAETRAPKLRQDGHVENRACVTDWPTALEVIRASADPDPESPRYAALRASIEARVWQDPQEVLSTPEEREIAWEWLCDARDGIAASAREAGRWPVVAAEGLAGQPTGRGWGCPGCDYAALCAEQFRAGDPAAVAATSYRRGGDRYLAELAPGGARADFSPQDLRGARGALHSPAQDLRRVARGAEDPT